MKSLLDEGDDYFSLHKMVFSDISSSKRKSILSIISRQAAKLMHLEKNSKIEEFNGRVKILSDVDDTLQASGG